jgi:hypothetical protein
MSPAGIGFRHPQAGHSPSGPLIAHWNGTAWTITPSLAAGTLTEITARSASDVWAVGYTTGPQTLTLHWDGTTWTTVPSANVGSASQLTSVSASPGAAIIWLPGTAASRARSTRSPFRTADGRGTGTGRCAPL